MMTEEEVLKMFLFCCYSSEYSHYGIFVDTLKHAREISEQLRHLHNTVPSWVAPKLLRAVIHNVQFDNLSQITIGNNPSYGCGVAFSAVAVWNGIKNYDKLQECLWPCLPSGRSFIRFE